MRNLIVILTSLIPSLAHATDDSSSSIAARSSLKPVVGGTTVPVGKWRDVVLVVGQDATCTGTLIAPDVVLTAGHCIDIAPYEVRTDTVDYAQPGGDRIPVKWARAYPSWEDRYDIGVLVLDHVARGAPRKVAAACASRTGLVADHMLEVVGFGLTREDGSGNNTQLREAQVPVTDPNCTMDQACQAAVAPHGEFMAGGGGADSCFGDSGGPVYLDTPDGPALVGVVSRGTAVSGAPCGGGGIYVRADKVVSWIQSVTDRKLERTTCDGLADGEDPEADDESSGCAAGSAGVGLPLGLAGFAMLRRRQKRVKSTDSRATRR